MKKNSREGGAGRSFLKPCFSHLRKLFSQFLHKIFVIILLGIIGLENFLLSFSQSCNHLFQSYDHVILHCCPLYLFHDMWMGIFALHEAWLRIDFFHDSWIYIFTFSGNCFFIFSWSVKYACTYTWFVN